jgi:arylsulfatase A-like enzyme
VPDVLAWWRGNAQRERFLYVHLLPPHQPYDPPPPHSALFGADATERREGFTDFLTELDERREVAVDDPLVARIRARYDAGVHYADSVLGELLAGLGADGGLDRALVVVTSDHGEGFAEHGRLLHGSTAFVEMSRVPLVFRWPGVRPRVHGELVRLRDLATTLCDAVDAPWRGGVASGRSFLAELAGAGASTPKPALTRSWGTAPAWALRDSRWTLMQHRSSSAVLLFDRAADPGEHYDVSALHPEVASALTAALRARLAADREAAPSGPRESVATYWKQIRELGYTESEMDGDGAEDAGVEDGAESAAESSGSER